MVKLSRRLVQIVPEEVWPQSIDSAIFTARSRNVYRTLVIGRQGGNSVTGYPSAYVDGPYWWQWDVKVTARQWITGGSNFRPLQSTAWTPYSAGFSWSDSLTNLGPGTFNQGVAADYRCVAPPNYTNNRPEATGSVAIQRPTVTGNDAFWYLGSPGLSDPTNGFYTATLLSGNKSCASSLVSKLA